MHEAVTREQIRAAVSEARAAGRRVGLVPTMGFLHQGHLSLVRAARQRADCVVMSVFVNPLQFGPNEDFSRYPRDLERDRRLAREAGVDVLWTPGIGDVLGEGHTVTVDPGPVGSILEGAIRPGHFAGVLTVVLKLFNVVSPDVAVFGRKDAQQFALISRMVLDLDVPVELLLAPTVREADGLAMSSRNAYLGPRERHQALAIARALGAGVEAFRGGERRAGKVVAAAYGELGAAEGVVTEYINVINAATFTPNDRATEKSFLVVAARVGPTRLIDNVVLGEGLENDPRG